MSPGPMTTLGRLASWSGLLPASYRSSLAARCAPARREANLSWCRLRNPPSRSREGVVDDRWRRGLSISGKCRLGQAAFKEVGGVGVDTRDNVYVFNRGDHPMIVFDRNGNFLRSWGEGLFARAHGLHIDVDDNLYCTDDGDHTVRKCSADGKVLLTIGLPHNPAL